MDCRVKPGNDERSRVATPRERLKPSYTLFFAN
jgi:hypothetical protein